MLASLHVFQTFATGGIHFAVGRSRRGLHFLIYLSSLDFYSHQRHTVDRRDRLPKKEVAMSSSAKPFKTVTFEDGSVAVVRTDPRKPQLLEVIAIFFDASRARSYAEMEERPIW